MQKASIIIALSALAVALVALFYQPGESAHPAGQAEMDTPRKSRASLEQDSSGSANIAFVYGDSINLGYQFILDQQDDLINSTRQSEGKLRRSLEKAEKEYGELMAYIQSGDASEDDMAIAQQRTMELQYELQGLEQQEQERLARKEQAMQREIVDRLNTFLKSFAEENGIDLIINKGVSGEGVLYGSEPYDITAEVLRGLNEAYALENIQDTP